MLVLARKVGQRIKIGDNIVILVIEVRGDQVRLGVEAPRSIPVHREEIWVQLQAEKNAEVAEAETTAAGEGLAA